MPWIRCWGADEINVHGWRKKEREDRKKLRGVSLGVTGVWQDGDEMDY